jgi:hypothetical protein
MCQVTGRTYQSAPKPAGGYCFINATALVATYTAYRQNIIRLFDLRVWLACHELTERRCALGKGQRPRYKVEELHGLVGGVGGEHLRNSIRRLETAGLLGWGEAGLHLTVDASNLPNGFWRQVEAKLALVQNNRRKVPVPRRVLRMLAQGTTRAQAATVLGHLLRGLYYRNRQCNSGGTCKASWVAEVFDVDLRNIKAARKRLVEIGWLVLQPTPQGRLNRWGVSFTVNLEWSSAPRLNQELKTPPPERLSTTGLPPLINNQELSTRSRNQEPATRRPKTGVCKQTGGQPKPSLRDLQPADLSSPQRLNELLRQAQREGLVTESECDRLRFFGAAERARSVATRNPCGLFATLVRQQLWHYITQRDEDAARQRLKSMTSDLADRSGYSWAAGVAGATVRCIDGTPGLSRDLKEMAGSFSPTGSAQGRTSRRPVPVSAVLAAAGLTHRGHGRSMGRNRTTRVG